MSDKITIEEYIHEKKKAAKDAFEQMREKMRSTESYKKKAAMSERERAERAIDRVAKNMKTFREHTGEALPSYDAIQRKAAAIAEMTERKRNK